MRWWSAFARPSQNFGKPSKRASTADCDDLGRQLPIGSVKRPAHDACRPVSALCGRRVDARRLQRCRLRDVGAERSPGSRQWSSHSRTGPAEASPRNLTLALWVTRAGITANLSRRPSPSP
eukprot:NODE_2030_length_1011_cov_200.972803.p2 GENE.NODE_2030_length_1011_cov_200.972803~~NODE_2030_length_1011_cov_200.972803.p2  ORF type:complete len:121 (-),score=7.05 NODE_2030_length_1011_cov_200.972803:107-469(-)